MTVDNIEAVTEKFKAPGQKNEPSTRPQRSGSRIQRQQTQGEDGMRLTFNKKGNGGLLAGTNALRDNPDGQQDSPLEIGSNLSGSPSQDFGHLP